MTINAKWTHPSLALRLLKANLGSLETQCEIIEFALHQPLCEKIEPILSARPRILGVSVSIWNHLATIELLEELEKKWTAHNEQKPIIVLGGPEVSHLPKDANIFKYADCVIRGEGETAFSALSENIFNCSQPPAPRESFFTPRQNILQDENKDIILNGLVREPGWFPHKSCSFSGEALQNCDFHKEVVQKLKFPNNSNVQNDLAAIKTAYHLYTDEDAAKKLIYVESTRGCPFECEFCLSAVKPTESNSAVREFPLEHFLAEMDLLVNRGVRTIKFLDRTFNVNINRAVKICEFFLQKLDERKRAGQAPFVVHFEMVPSLFPQELRDILARFPPDSLRLEIGIQTLNPEVSARIRRPGWQNQSIDPEKELETIRFLRKNTNAIIHADLIAGLPGEDLASFGRGFDRLWQAVSEDCFAAQKHETKNPRVEIQLGILKQLPGAPISHHNKTFGMKYNRKPPYEIEETSSISAVELQRVKNFAAFWERLVNRGLLSLEGGTVFEKFMALSDSLFAHFGKNWGIDKTELIKKATDILKI